MRKILTVILASAGSLAFAQEKVNLSRSIDDDGRSLVIRVNGNSKGKHIDYNRTFNIEGLTKAHRVAIADRVMDSLRVDRIEYTIAPLSPQPPTAPKSVNSQNAISANNTSLYQSWNSTEKEEPQHPTTGLRQAFTKEIWLDDNGFLYLRYSFSKEGDEYIFEKSTDATEKSESERQKFIKDFEEEIELPAI